MKGGYAWDTASWSRGIEANLEASGQECEELSWRQAPVPPGFQQPEGEVLGRAEAGWEGVAEQAAALQ